MYIFLHPGLNPHLIIMYDPCNVLLNFVCQYFFEGFCSYVQWWYWPVTIFFGWLWYQGCCLAEWVQKWSSCNIWNSLEKYMLILLSKCLVETTCEASSYLGLFSLGFVCLLFIYLFFLLIQSVFIGNCYSYFLFCLGSIFGRLCILRICLFLPGYPFYWLIFHSSHLWLFVFLWYSYHLSIYWLSLVLILAKGLAILFVYRESTVNWIILFLFSHDFQGLFISALTLCVVAVLFLITLGIRSGFYWGNFFFCFLR